jgi:branched-chain amino acid transport system substrate-binding protein
MGELLMLLFALLSCSLGTTQWAPCEAASECREAFGFGHTCGDDGFCAEVPNEPRCMASWPEDLLLRPENYPDVAVVGSLYDHSTDMPEVQSTRLAIKEVDDSDGVNSRPIGLVQCSYEETALLDALGADEAAVAMADHLARDLGAFAIIGPATSGVTEAVYNQVDAAPLIISPSATSPALTWLDTPDKPARGAGRLWRTAPPDSLQGLVLAGVVEDTIGKSNQRVALVYQLGPYGEGLAEVFVEEWGGPNHVADRFTFENDTQRNSAASSAAVSTYDAIVFISSDLPDVTSFLASLAADGDVPSTPLFLADAARDMELLVNTVGTAAEDLWPNVLGTSPAVPSGDEYDAFAAAYAGMYPGQSAEASSYSAYAYDAAWLAMYGASWASAQEPQLDGQGAANGLRHISAEDKEVLTVGPGSWNQVQAQLESGTSINVRGASGELDYDPATEETSGPIEVWAIAGGSEPAFYVVDTVAP